MRLPLAYLAWAPGAPAPKGAGRAARIALAAAGIGLGSLLADGGGAVASAGEQKPAFGPNDITTLFFISKSDDRNRVDYGMRLDANCMPSGKEPVFPYWREFENSPPVRTHPLGLLEYYPYGIATQRIVGSSARGVEYFVRLKRIHRDLFVTTNKEADGRCTAMVRTTIAGQDRSELVSAYVKLRRAMSVEYVDIHGRAASTGQPIEERITQ